MSTPKLQQWLLFADRDASPYLPTSEVNYTTDKFWDFGKGEVHSPSWAREQWLIRSALIATNELHEAAEVLSPHDLTFEPWWEDEETFDFAEHKTLHGFDIHPWCFTWKHPIADSLIVELRHDFVRYHALHKIGETEYRHPLEDLVVARTSVDTHEIFNPTPNVSVHVDFLRDYLAARRVGLIISIVADRFTNSKEELGIQESEDRNIDSFTWISTYVNPPNTEREYYRMRSIFRRNIPVEGYQKPKVGRSPWWYSGQIENDISHSPRFIIDEEGNKSTLQELSSLRYLYFRPEVLAKYTQTPGYRVFFHMRNWGVASPPGGIHTIDVGINSEGLVNAFAPDLARMRKSEQDYWASFSSLPSGEVCEEMVQSRMQQRPPHSPSVIDIIQNSRSNLSSAFQKRFSLKLFADCHPSKQELCQLSVGPLSSHQFSELLNLSKILYGWMIESIMIKSLRAAAGEPSRYDKNWRQIRLIEELLCDLGLEKVNARSVTNPMRGLYQLRIDASHVGSPELERAFNLLGASDLPRTARAAWSFCVDAISESFNDIAKVLA